MSEARAQPRGGRRPQVFEVFATSTPPFDTVIHFAAVAYVGESMAEPLRYYHNITSNTGERPGDPPPGLETRHVAIRGRLRPVCPSPPPFGRPKSAPRAPPARNACCFMFSHPSGAAACGHCRDLAERKRVSKWLRAFESAKPFGGLW